MTITLRRSDAFAERLLADARDGLARYVELTGRPLRGPVLDIGAHYGLFALAAMEAGASAVLAVEAATDNYSALAENAHDTGVMALHAAAWGHSGEILTLRYAAGGNSGQRSVMFHAGFPVANLVSTMSFWTLLNVRRQWAYVKIDIEGGEWSFLGGPEAIGKLLKGTEFVDLEIHPLDDPQYFTPRPTYHVEQVADWFRDAGGRVVWTPAHVTRLFVAAP